MLDKEDWDACACDLSNIAKEIGTNEIREDLLHQAEDILEQEKGLIEGSIPTTRD